VFVKPAPGPFRVVLACGRSFRQARWAALTRGASRLSPAGSVSHTCPPLTFGFGRLEMPFWRTQATNLRARVSAADNGLPPSAIQTFFGGGEDGPPPTSVVVGDCAPAGPDSPRSAAASSPSPAREATPAGIEPCGSQCIVSVPCWCLSRARELVLGRIVEARRSQRGYGMRNRRATADQARYGC
jgi:hypothetical protein